MNSLAYNSIAKENNNDKSMLSLMTSSPYISPYNANSRKINHITINSTDTLKPD
jgi:hypothetical protein